MKNAPRLVLAALLACVVAAGIGCATASKKAAGGVPLPEQQTALPPDDIEATVLAETKKTAVEKLECPEDQVTVRCTAHDAQNGCIAVEATGCGKTLDYSFGNE